MMKMQAQIDELYSRGENAKGGALLAFFCDTFLRDDLRRDQGNRRSTSRHPTPGPSNQHDTSQRQQADQPDTIVPLPSPFLASAPPPQALSAPQHEQQAQANRVRRADAPQQQTGPEGQAGDRGGWSTVRRSPRRLIEEDPSEDSRRSPRHHSPKPTSPRRGPPYTRQTRTSPPEPVFSNRYSPLRDLDQVEEQRDRNHTMTDRRPEQLATRTETAQATGEKSEEELAKVMLDSGKGCMVLSNGDVIENGRRILNDESEQMDKVLTPLSQVLQVWLKTFKAYIPLTVFNKRWLLDDQREWEVKDPQSEAKILKGGAAVKAYGGKPPPNKLLMQFEDWLDSMKLFVRYVEEAGWVTQAAQFKAHMDIVMELRDSIGGYEGNGRSEDLQHLESSNAGLRRGKTGMR
ncbi:uncharacterized protein MELLADRAFT_84835 [Melampsora larici-populina 98AG31]|uniref:Uncharacterized protein n=1 Tax=Melampsora larici-populina (strain 98AG31 / pathotype 3-4-7) TaxID=747676 RepID=F4SCM8_MELLP|nr:uncharacterized protein MELLADRAFT_84835 [Melampsora larici-populina 98AG31]EGF97605.1 hypothetical protein MELLADRAFT_84835 [Melampsora larici-populina 98AG31]